MAIEHYWSDKRIRPSSEFSIRTLFHCLSSCLTSVKLEQSNERPSHWTLLPEMEKQFFLFHNMTGYKSIINFSLSLLVYLIFLVYWTLSLPMSPFFLHHDNTCFSQRIFTLFLNFRSFLKVYFFFETRKFSSDDFSYRRKFHCAAHAWAEISFVTRNQCLLSTQRQRNNKQIINFSFFVHFSSKWKQNKKIFCWCSF